MNNNTLQQKLIDKIKSSNNILITVSRNPEIDQLTSALALALAINRMGKRAAAVFSGQIPKSLNFLKPEKTFENNADSLRDFIISLDKEKAKRLQCRTEGNFVKVYITPYHAKITAEDLHFEEGDFNVELVIAIGVTNREDLDMAIASHGKIFHDAIVATINLAKTQDQLGSISLQGDGTSCYAEMLADLISHLPNGKGGDPMDSAIATALLTGVVSATDQFRNNRTTSKIMTLSADLMARGANQQLISSELASKETSFEPNQDQDAVTIDQSINPDTAAPVEASVSTTVPATEAPVVETPRDPVYEKNVFSGVSKDDLLGDPLADKINKMVVSENKRIADAHSDKTADMVHSQLNQLPEIPDTPAPQPIEQVEPYVYTPPTTAYKPRPTEPPVPVAAPAVSTVAAPVVPPNANDHTYVNAAPNNLMNASMAGPENEDTASPMAGGKAENSYVLPPSGPAAASTVVATTPAYAAANQVPPVTSPLPPASSPLPPQPSLPTPPPVPDFSQMQGGLPPVPPSPMMPNISDMAASAAALATPAVPPVQPASMRQSTQPAPMAQPAMSPMGQPVAPAMPVQPAAPAPQQPATTTDPTQFVIPS